MLGMSSGVSVMEDFASAPRPVRARSPCLPCVFTRPKGISRDAHTSPPSSVVTCRARNVPAGTVTDSQPTTCAPLHRPAQSKADVFCLPCLPTIPAISPDIFMAGCGPTLKTSARGDSSPEARLPVRICTTPLLPGSFPVKLTSNQYRVESPARSEPTTARRSFPTPALPPSAKLPTRNEADRLLTPALAELGLAAVPAVWDAPDVCWEEFQGVVVRSCWDYHHRLEEFLTWVARLERAGIPVWNPPAVL